MAEKQLIISIAREYGSAGHVIAEKLSEIYGIPYYDSNLLDEIAKEKEVDAAELHKYDEVPKNRFLSTVFGNYSSSNEDNIAFLQFEHMKKKAERGDSFIIVGRCGETILDQYPCTISLFVMADMEQKFKRVMEIDKLSTVEDAEKQIALQDKRRKTYHDNYCKGAWEDVRNYDLAINSSRLGIEDTVKLIVEYIGKKQK